MRQIKRLPLGCLEVDRLPLCPQTLDLANHLARGGSVPPIHVVRAEEGRWRVLDGRHRYVASKLVGRREILARFA